MQLIGNRTSLYPIHTSMVQLLYEAFIQMDEECRILTGTRDEITLDYVNGYVRSLTQSTDAHHFYMQSNQLQQIIGELSITDIDLQNKHANFRFSIYNPIHRDKGLGAEAMQLALDFGFNELNLHRIELTVYAGNERAIHLYTKFGFKKEGIIRDLYYWNGKYHSAILMSLLEKEYLKIKN